MIDLYYQHRVDPDTPIEETVGAMAELVRQGQGPISRVVRSRRGDVSAARMPFIRSRHYNRNTHSGRAIPKRRFWRMPRAGYRFGPIQSSGPRIFDRTNQNASKNYRKTTTGEPRRDFREKISSAIFTCEASRRNRSREKCTPAQLATCLGARAGKRHCTHSGNQTSQIFAGKCRRA